MAQIVISKLPPSPDGTGSGTPLGTDLSPATDTTDTSSVATGVTKKYTRAAELNYTLIALGLTTYTAVLGATTLALTATYDNGTAGVGATLTNAGAQAAFTVDGVTFAAGNRVLIKNQASTLQNGIYVVSTLGTASTNWVLTRATDYDAAADIIQYGVMVVNKGTVNIGLLFQETAAGPFTIGTSAITFSQFVTSTATGTVLSVSGTTNRITSTGGTTPVIDISASYVGQTSITTLGAITAGTWNSTIISAVYGGTGVANLSGSTITLGGALTLSGAFTTAFTITGNTSVTFPTSGTLATTAGASGIVNSGLINQATYYSAAGTTVSGAANVLIQNSTANLQITRPTPASSGVLQYLNVTATADTGLTASTEVIVSSFVGATRTWATGALTLQRETAFSQPTYAFAGASVVTNAANVGIGGAPSGGTNATLTNTSALYIPTASVSNSTNSYGLNVAAQSGATNNYGATFQTGNVGIGTAAPAAVLAITRASVSSSGAQSYLSVTPVSDTGITSSTENPVISLAASTRTWATGALTTQREVRLSAPTYAFAGSSTITNAATLGITGAPVAGTNGTLTNSHGALISAGAVGAGTAASYGLTVNAQTGASNNYVAQFIGGNTGFGTATPSAPVHAISTTEPIRAGYDASNYMSVIVGSTGAVTLDAVGAGAAFTLNDATTIAGTITNSAGGAMVNKQYTANSGASITVNSSDGAYQTITLTANTTITLGSVPSSLTEREFILELVQDGTGGRTVAWSNITFANNGGANPVINTAIGGSTYIGISGTSTRWVGYSTDQGLGLTSGATPPAGYKGYAAASNIAIGSAVSLTTGTAANITSVTLAPGNYRLSANIGFIPAAGTTPTILVGSINTTSATQATSPNGGAFVRQAQTFPATESQVLPVGSFIVTPTVSTTYYLVATATFAVSTLTAYGSLTWEEFS